MLWNVVRKISHEILALGRTIAKEERDLGAVSRPVSCVQKLWTIFHGSPQGRVPQRLVSLVFVPCGGSDGPRAVRQCAAACPAVAFVEGLDGSHPYSWWPRPGRLRSCFR